MKTIDERIGSLRPDARPWPYLVIRWMAAVYGTAEIRIVASEEFRAQDDRSITIVDPTYRPGDPITEPMRQQIMDAAIARCRCIKHSLCVVFGERDAVYVEASGRTRHSAHPPHGGLRFEGATRTHRPA